MTEPLTHDRALANPNLYDETTPYKTIHRSSAKMSLFEKYFKVIIYNTERAMWRGGGRRGAATWRRAVEIA